MCYCIAHYNSLTNKRLRDVSYMKNTMSTIYLHTVVPRSVDLTSAACSVCQLEQKCLLTAVQYETVIELRELH